jgi:hypothetical protein
MRRGGRILPRAPAPPRPEIILYGNIIGDIAPGESSGVAEFLCFVGEDGALLRFPR